VVAAIAVWVVHARQVGYWLQLHTGTVNESGPYYGFWSGFGSDLEEFGILGGIAAVLYSGSSQSRELGACAFWFLTRKADVPGQPKTR
jgi:hypothetical protein